MFQWMKKIYYHYLLFRVGRVVYFTFALLLAFVGAYMVARYRADALTVFATALVSIVVIMFSFAIEISSNALHFFSNTANFLGLTPLKAVALLLSLNGIAAPLYLGWKLLKVKQLPPTMISEDEGADLQLMLNNFGKKVEVETSALKSVSNSMQQILDLGEDLSIKAEESGLDISEIKGILGNVKYVATQSETLEGYIDRMQLVMDYVIKDARRIPGREAKSVVASLEEMRKFLELYSREFRLIGAVLEDDLPIADKLLKGDIYRVSELLEGEREKGHKLGTLCVMKILEMRKTLLQEFRMIDEKRSSKYYQKVINDFDRGTTEVKKSGGTKAPVRRNGPSTVM